MFYYSRQIVYLDLLDAGHKVGNAGFLKLEETGEGLRWRIQIRGLYETDQGFYEIRDETGALVDKMLLEQGAGVYSGEFDRQAESRGGRAYREICGIRISLAGNRAVEGRWKCGGKEEAEKKESEKKDIEKKDTEKKDTEKRGFEKKGALERHTGRRMDDITGRGPIADRGEDRPGGVTGNALEAAEYGSAVTTETCTTPERGSTPIRQNRQEKKGPFHPETSSKQSAQAVQEPVREALFEDKWQQLQHIYPVVHPFGDQREYLSIAPKDFVVLSMEYQKMVHNSFLLHGYYNYRHIILGRFVTNGEETFYLGVPGVYYDREKMAAEMFGFEAFEGRTSPAEPGSFGYYMKRVRI